MRKISLSLVSTVFALLTTVVPKWAYADIFVCVEDGQKVYRDRPCKENRGRAITKRDPNDEFGRRESASFQLPRQKNRYIQIRQ